MNICQQHWDRLRAAMKSRGLDHLGAKNAMDVHRSICNEMEGRSAENDYDPLLDCNFMIWSEGLRILGLSLMSEPGLCPICQIVGHIEKEWIDGPADAALKHAKEVGLV